MKPIIMSTEDVRGILDGRKTMLRVPVKTEATNLCITEMFGPCGMFGDRPLGYQFDRIMPAYEVGDVLYVREAWNNMCRGCEDCSHTGYQYKADGQPASCIYDKAWCSPIFMPRQAARLFLRVTDVRVERVQDIRFTDALSEGVKPDFTEYEGRLEHPVIALANAISAQNSALVAFKKHWNARNAKRGYGWGSNPWVWVIEFERTPSGAIGPETDRTAPNGDKGAES